ncbi:3-hydroxyacyl-thioester dehydratase X-like [Acipenser ruthenus]|uniref:3-hydroxyacyl-thioester dehydratase X-like n=1 Tax=Acipenser ruthenus TaxID=7906 RepID=UPI00274105F2|nr:3-hydroxyacyl-thioester dehydratase X-like [Acipenser ruthenus]
MIGRMELFIIPWGSLYLASFFLITFTVLYYYVYRSHKLYKEGAVVFDCQKQVPSWFYLLCRLAAKVVLKRQGRLYNNTNSTGGGSQVTFTLYNCRLESKGLRQYCSVCGYGWDYPDSTNRDIPVCYPEILFFRLLAMVISSDGFRLSPLGLIHVQQTMRTSQPVDEIKKGPFFLQAAVKEYRSVELGIEVDIVFELKDRVKEPVWEGIMTLLSRDMKKLNRKKQHTQESCEPEEVKVIEILVPWYTGLKYAFASLDYNPHHLFSPTAKLLGYKSPIAHGMWMVSRCLAEIEKREGTDAIQAPVCVKVRFKQPLLMPGKVVIKYWETFPDAGTWSHKSYQFRMEEIGTRLPHVVGEISGVESYSINAESG